MMRARHRNETPVAAIILIAVELLCFAGMFYAAYLIDKSHGITVCQSLANWGMHLC